MTDVHARTIPAGGSDDLVSLFDLAQEAYDLGKRADPDDLANGDSWAVALHAVAEHRAELATAVVLEAVEMLRRPAQVEAA